jgi:hypothetical protein
MNHNQNQNEISWSKNLINNSKCLGLPPLGGEARHRRTKRPRWDVCTGTSGASDPWPEMASCRRQTIEYTVLDTRPANTSGSTIGSGKIKIVVVFSCVCFLLLKWYAFGRPKTRTISGHPKGQQEMWNLVLASFQGQTFWITTARFEKSVREADELVVRRMKSKTEDAEFNPPRAPRSSKLASMQWSKQSEFL